ncbi:hypothetical protein DEU42_102272 [Flavobacterium sp. AG291]|nr:hypothetical protein DEU42_102272 [Flavobacterium sp. AG291]
MKLFLFSASVTGALIISFFIIINVLSIGNLGDWILFSSLITLFFMCVIGIALNYKPSAIIKRVNSKIPDIFF